MSPYDRPFPSTWWLKRRPYFLFVVREATSVFVAAYCVFLLVLVHRLGQGPEAYAGLLEALRSPASVLLHLVVLAFALFHSVTWINLTPTIMVLEVGGKRVSPGLISAANFAAWAGLSALLAWVVLGT